MKVVLGNEKEIDAIRMMRTYNNNNNIRITITLTRDISLEEVKEFFTEEACSSISFVACGKTEIYDGYSLERVSESLDDARSELYVELSKDI